MYSWNPASLVNKNGIDHATESVTVTAVIKEEKRANIFEIMLSKIIYYYYKVKVIIHQFFIKNLWINIENTILSYMQFSISIYYQYLQYLFQFHHKNNHIEYIIFQYFE